MKKGKFKDPLASIEGRKQYSQEIRRIIGIGLAVNIFLAIAKILAGIFGNSQAVLADGVHTISDISTDLVLLIGVQYWSAPPDQNHPHGHRRIETVITALIGLILALVAIGIGYQALSQIREAHLNHPGIIALLAAVASIVVKELLYRWTLAVGKKLESSAVVANAWHHRSDAFSSIPVVLAVGGAIFLSGWYFLDHLGAILVAVFILQSAGKIIWPALQELMDIGVSQELIREIERISLNTEGVLKIHKCRTRHLGPGIQVDLHILVNSDLTVREGHEICEMVQRRLREEVPEVIDVTTHLEPVSDEEE